MQHASPDAMPALPGDVLIVEDDPIIALDFEDTILGLGVKTIRTAAGVAKALEMIAERAPDFALLDVGLVREKSFAIAERLDALKIPFIFVTGYGADVGLPAAFADRPRLPKPCSTDMLQALLKRGSGDGGRAEGSDRPRAFSSEVEIGSCQENASNQESRAPFRFYRNGKGSRKVT